MTNTETISLRLDLISAKAKQLSNDVKEHKLWEGQLSKGLSEIQEQLSIVQQEARTDR